MSKKLAVLRQFLEDADRLQVDAENAFFALKKEWNENDFDVTKVSQQTILNFYRPVHSFKSIASMVEEGKALEKVYHEIENGLPPLLKNLKWKIEKPKETFEKMELLLEWSSRYVSAIREKLNLCYQLKSDLREDNGVLITVNQESLWLPVGWIQGVYSRGEAVVNQVGIHYGQPSKMRLALIILQESGPQAVLWSSTEIVVMDRETAFKVENTLDLASFIQKSRPIKRVA